MHAATRRLLPSPVRSGILLVVSGPSGSGKTTLCSAARRGRRGPLLDLVHHPPAARGERDGRDLPLPRPRRLRDQGRRRRVPRARRRRSLHYGTLLAPVLDALSAGTDIAMDIDVEQPPRSASRHPAIRRATVDLFVMPPSEDELRRASPAAPTAPR